MASLLPTLLNGLNYLIKTEVGLLRGVDKEMKKMSSAHSSIEAVLEDAEQNHLQDKAIQDWWRKLKLAAYELEDILDECSTKSSDGKNLRFSKGYNKEVPAFSILDDRCPKLALLEGVKHLESLQRLNMCHNEVLVRLPEILQHVSSLQSLSVGSYAALTSLAEWLGNLTSLQWVAIDNYHKISSLPTSFQRLTNLKFLSITYCGPELARRCEKGKGEDWYKIAHVPEVYVHSNVDVPPAKPKAFCCLNTQSFEPYDD